MKKSHKIKLCVYGAPHTDTARSFDALEKAQELGACIAEQDCITTVPATGGFPLWVAKGAKQKQGMTVGFSPAANEAEHVTVYNLPIEHMDTVIYSGFGFAGSDLLLSRSSDAVIFGYGGIETVHEFWVAFQEGKTIGILQGDWDTEEILHDFLKGNEDYDHGNIVFGADPKELVKEIVKRAKGAKAKSYHL